MTLWPCLCDLVTILLFRSLFICRGLYLYTLLTRENLFNFYPCKQLKFEKLLSWIPIWFLGASVYLPYFNAAGYPGCWGTRVCNDHCLMHPLHCFQVVPIETFFSNCTNRILLYRLKVKSSIMEKKETFQVKCGLFWTALEFLRTLIVMLVTQNAKFHFRGVKDEMWTKCGPFQHFGSHADQVRNCRPLCQQFFIPSQENII